MQGVERLSSEPRMFSKVASRDEAGKDGMFNGVTQLEPPTDSALLGNLPCRIHLGPTSRLFPISTSFIIPPQ